MITLTIERVSLSVNNGTSAVTFTAIEDFDGQVRQADGSIVPGRTHAIRMSLRQVAHFCFEVSPLHAYYLSGHDYRMLDNMQLVNLFMGMKMHVERKLITAGTQLVDEATGEVKVSDHDFYHTDIKQMELNDLNTATCCGSAPDQATIVKTMTAVASAKAAWVAAQAK